MSRDCVVGECLGVRFGLAVVAMIFFLLVFLFYSLGLCAISMGNYWYNLGTGSTGINRVERIVFDSVAFSLRPVFIEPPFAI